jgi:hypothetical protein
MTGPLPCFAANAFLFQILTSAGDLLKHPPLHFLRDVQLFNGFYDIIGVMLAVAMLRCWCVLLTSGT